MHWLKENNFKYYENIVLDSQRLGALPEEDIPQEIINVVHQSTDVGIVDQKSNGYVPTKKTECGKKMWFPPLMLLQLYSYMTHPLLISPYAD